MRHVLPLLVALSLAFAPAPLPKKAKPEPRDVALELLQGEWVSAGRRIGGARFTDQGGTMTVSGRTLTYFSSGRATATWTIRIDPTKVPPWLDYRGGGTGIQLIYRLEGDTLTLSWDNYGKPARRPVDFNGGPGIGVAVYQRKKP